MSEKQPQPKLPRATIKASGTIVKGPLTLAREAVDQARASGDITELRRAEARVAALTGEDIAKEE